MGSEFHFERLSLFRVPPLDFTIEPPLFHFAGRWAWNNPGVYFRVPIPNFWLLFNGVHFLPDFYTISSRYDTINDKLIFKTNNKPYWSETVLNRI